MKNIIFLAFFLCLLTACFKEGPPGPKGPDGPPYAWPPGNITGYIELKTQFGGRVNARRDSVLLRIINTDSIISTYTDTTGYFHFDSILPGNYEISITKTGYDSLHLNVQHAGGKLDKFIGTTYLSQPVTTHLVSLSGSAIHESMSIRIPVTAVFQWPAPPGQLVSGFRFFLDRSATPGDRRIVSEASISMTQNIDGVRGKAFVTFKVPAASVPSGSQLYLTVAAAPLLSVKQTWIDYASGALKSYPYLGDSIKTTITYTE